MKPTPDALTDAELDTGFRPCAIDEEIELCFVICASGPLHHARPVRERVRLGRGTRAECVEKAFELSDEDAIENYTSLEDEQDKARAVYGAWGLTLWPPDPIVWRKGARSLVLPRTWPLRRSSKDDCCAIWCPTCASWTPFPRSVRRALSTAAYPQS
jgi:hypothetical protein